MSFRDASPMTDLWSECWPNGLIPESPAPATPPVGASRPLANALGKERDADQECRQPLSAAQEGLLATATALLERLCPVLAGLQGDQRRQAALLLSRLAKVDAALANGAPAHLTTAGNNSFRRAMWGDVRLACADAADDGLTLARLGVHPATPTR